MLIFVKAINESQWSIPEKYKLGLLYWRYQELFKSFMTLFVYIINILPTIILKNQIHISLKKEHQNDLIKKT